GMPVPLSITRTLLPQEVSPESRGLMGQPIPLVAPAAGGVGLAPILIMAAGGSIIVCVYLYVSAETAEAARRGDRERKCMSLLIECINAPKQPEWNRGEYGDYKDCGACFRDCKEHSAGKWPDKKCPRPN